jgi:periplasmic protein TonB
MFEHSLIDLERKPQPRRWISLPIAVGLHAVGLTAIAFASYWSVGTVPEPDSIPIGPMKIIATFQERPGGDGQRPPVTLPERNREKQRPPTPEQPVQPTAETVPERVPTNTSSTSVGNVISLTGTDDENHDFGDDSACPDCPVGDYPVGPPIGPSASVPDDQTPRPITVGMTLPEIVHQVKPRYPELARRTGTQGTVIVEAVIDEQGRVTNVRVLSGQPMGLDKAAIEAIQQWRFKPATLAGKPVKVYYTLTANFTIRR